MAFFAFLSGMQHDYPDVSLKAFAIDHLAVQVDTVLQCEATVKTRFLGHDIDFSVVFFRASTAFIVAWVKPVLIRIDP
jgi:hypothetical protein